MKPRTIRNFSVLTIVAAALTLAATSGIVAGQGAQPKTPSPANPHATHDAPAPSSAEALAPPAAAQARLAAVERVCNILHDRETGEPVSHQGVEHPYLWSYRRMEAQRAVEKDKEHGVSAIESHLQRMRDLAKHIADAKAAYSTFEVASTEYYVAEAEDLLARAKAK